MSCSAVVLDTKTMGISMLITVFQSLILLPFVHGSHYVAVDGTHFIHNGERVFMSGVNQPFLNFGEDFGNGGFQKGINGFRSTFRFLQENGGNSVRMWVYADAKHEPRFDSAGHAFLPTDFLSDMKAFLHEAQKHNVLVNFVFWNGARSPKNPHVNGLFTDDSKMAAYLDRVLKPIAAALKDEPALLSYEIINEPEGLMQTGHADSHRCYDTSKFHKPLAGWTGQQMPMRNLLRFIGKQADAIHDVDPKALVTVGSWRYKANSDVYGTNFYSDACLKEASGTDKGHLDYYQIHTYQTSTHEYRDGSPFTVPMSRYNLDKPVVIGEFSQASGAGHSSHQQYTHAYYHGYSGAWSWAYLHLDDVSDTHSIMQGGLHATRNKNEQAYGGRVNIDL